MATLFSRPRALRLPFLGIHEGKLEAIEFRNSCEVSEILRVGARLLLDDSCCQGSRSYYYLKKKLTFNFAGPLVKPRGLLWPADHNESTIYVTSDSCAQETALKNGSVPYVINWPVFGLCLDYRGVKFTAAESITVFNLLKTKRKLLYLRNQSVPRCKHFPPRL